MKKVLIILLFVLITTENPAQVFYPVWESCFGGAEVDEGRGITFANGSYWVIAGTNSSDGDISYNHGAYDYWFLNIDSSGSLISEKTFGGSNADGGYLDIMNLNDSVFYISGITKSNDGDIVDNHWPGNSNIWVLKIDKQGQILWEEVLGGNKVDWMRDMEITLDRGLIILGLTNSDSGDISNPNGGWDLWMIKLNSDGEKQWDFSLGGEGFEEGGSVIQTSDGGYLVAGSTDGRGGGNFDTTCNFHGMPGGGFTDVWVVKLDSLRNMEWQQCYGGIYYDDGLEIIETVDGYVCLAITMSNDGDVSGFHGVPGDLDYGDDIWVFKIDKQGNLIWQNCLGGLYYEWARNIFPTSDGGYMIVGTTQSDDGDVEGFNGYMEGDGDDIWFAKIDSLGNLTWQYCYGGLGVESIYRGVHQKGDYHYVLTIGTDTDDWQCWDENLWPPDLRVVELVDTTYVGLPETKNKYENEQILIYPNPAHTVVSIEFSKEYLATNTRIEILSLNGTTILSEKLNVSLLQLDICKFNSGLYVLKIQNAKSLIIKKLIIQK